MPTGTLNVSSYCVRHTKCVAEKASFKATEIIVDKSPCYFTGASERKLKKMTESVIQIIDTGLLLSNNSRSENSSFSPARMHSPTAMPWLTLLLSPFPDVMASYAFFFQPGPSFIPIHGKYLPDIVANSPPSSFIFFSASRYK